MTCHACNPDRPVSPCHTRFRGPLTPVTSPRKRQCPGCPKGRVEKSRPLDSVCKACEKAGVEVMSLFAKAGDE